MVVEGANLVYYLENFVVYHFYFDITNYVICTANNDIM